MDRDEKELHDLIGALQNNRINKQQHKRLDDLLTESESARRAYYECVDIDLSLRRRFASLDPLPSRADDRKTLARPRAQTGTLSVWSHLAVLAATAAVILVSQHLLVSADQDDALPVMSVASVRQSGTYLATLTKSADCVWDSASRPRFDGQRLLTDSLRLMSGVAEFRFDSGVRVILQGPASMKIESSNSALLSQGQIVLHGSDAVGPFSLHTPTTTLIDIGTEYGAAVDPQGATEVHVFEGEVSVNLRPDSTAKQQSVQLTEGEAGRFDAAGNRSIDLAEKRFARRVPDVQLPRSPGTALPQAYEAFDYPADRLGRAEGGLGWDGAWRSTVFPNARPSASKVLVGSPLGIGNCLRVSGRHNVSWRTLRSPVRLDRDAVYYLSFLMKKQTEAKRGIRQFGSVSLQSAQSVGDDSVISLGMSSESCLIATLNEQQVIAAPPLPFNEAVLIVAKIASGAQAPDQLMVRWYGPEEKVGSTEPFAWTAVSSPSYSDAVLSEISVRSGGDVAYLFDEICVATSWSAAIKSASITRRNTNQ